MTIRELVERLEAIDNGLDHTVVIEADDGRLWDIGLGFSRAKIAGAAPYDKDNDFPMVLVLSPDRK